MKRKNIIVIVAGLGFVAAMFGLSQIRSYSCGDFKRIQYEYASTMKPLLQEALALDDPQACKIFKDKVLPLLEQQKDDLEWFKKCWSGQQEIQEARDLQNKFYGPVHDEFRKICVPLGM